MSADEYGSRRGQVRERLAELRIDALIVSHLPNVRYLTGFTGSNALLIITERTDWLLTDPRYDIQAHQETSCSVRIQKRNLWLGLKDRLRQRSRIGFESAHVTHASFAALRNAIGKAAHRIPAAGVVEELRKVKSPSEINTIRHSVRINSTALAEALGRLRPEMSEAELAAEIDYRQRLHGATGSAFETIVASGLRTALPHARPSPAALKRGALLLIDMGALYQGYSSDMTRVFSLGRPSRRARVLYSAVLESQQAAIAAIRPGVTAASIDKAARTSLGERGLDKFFTHSTGHGLGLEIHEAPALRRSDSTVLQPGMVITVEPGVYLRDEGGMRIEDTVLVTASGVENLTPTSKELLEL
jgi:Xaa-Pro aminopeptidase